MPTITLVTEINAPIEICFDLARSIELHQIRTANTSERAIAGTTKGLIGLHKTVTWEAIHFGIKQQLSSKITTYNRPFSFVDEQTKGAFKSIYHLHQFEEIDGKTIKKDTFKFSSPYGVFGRFFNFLILTNYLKKLLANRNNIIKEFAETYQCKTVLNKRNYL